METDNKKVEVKKTSTIENFGKISLQVGEKLGKAVTEWFTGKPPSEEEKKRRQRAKLLKSVQEEAQFERDLELARNGQYVIPEPKVKAKKKEDTNIFSNLGKHNPLEGFNNINTIGTKDFGVEEYSGMRRGRR